MQREDTRRTRSFAADRDRRAQVSLVPVSAALELNSLAFPCWNAKEHNLFRAQRLTHFSFGTPKCAVTSVTPALTHGADFVSSVLALFLFPMTHGNLWNNSFGAKKIAVDSCQRQQTVACDP